MMQKYFGCADESDNGARMPLMGYPSYGRDSHQSNRLVPEDVMSYAGGNMISPLTLAMLEDIGVYVANYTAADSISYGKNQGCGYATSRCESRRDDRSANASASPWRCGNTWTSGVWSHQWGLTPCVYGDCNPKWVSTGAF